MVLKARWWRRISSSRTLLCAHPTTALSLSGSSNRGRTSARTSAVVMFQDVDEIDIAVDVPEAVMAADLRSADIVQMLASFNCGTRTPVSSPCQRGRAESGPDYADIYDPRRHEGPSSRREFTARHDGHRHSHVSPRQYPGRPDFGADHRDHQRECGSGSGVGHRAGWKGGASPGENRLGHGRQYRESWKDCNRATASPWREFRFFARE